jgi:hypothetical protein
LEDAEIGKLYDIEGAFRKPLEGPVAHEPNEELRDRKRVLFMKFQELADTVTPGRLGLTLDYGAATEATYKTLQVNEYSSHIGFLNLWSKEHGLRWVLDVIVARALLFIEAGLILLVVLRDTSPSLALIVTIGFVIWEVLLQLACSLYVSESNRLFGLALLVQWIILAAVVTVQWIRRSASWFARVSGVLLALLTPLIVVGWRISMIKSAEEVDSIRLLPLVVTSLVVYALFFPFFQGNLSRLKYLPSP